MTSKEKFIRALNRQKVEGRVPHFELVFFLTMEAFGKLHPAHRNYYQWNQMSPKEQKLHIEDIAYVYVETAKRYGHSAIFVQSGADDYDFISKVLESIRVMSGDEYFVMLHGDPTYSIPDGNHMLDFTAELFEAPDKLKAEAAQRVEKFAGWSRKLEGSGLLDGFALCADYCFNTNPFFGPELFDEFIKPYLKDIITEYRNQGYYVIKHTDGNIMPILDQMVSCGPHAIHSLDPQGGVDLGIVRDLVGDKVCLIGNVNCGLLQTGTDEECIADIRRSLDDGMKSPGYIFSTSNCIYTGLPLERYELMLRIWNEYGVY
ncbi:MAG: uroporphyrinogen decarboxylase family protein [Candidatus Delongbacteria bacterium]